MAIVKAAEYHNKMERMKTEKNMRESIGDDDEDILGEDFVRLISKLINCHRGLLEGETTGTFFSQLAYMGGTPLNFAACQNNPEILQVFSKFRNALIL